MATEWISRNDVFAALDMCAVLAHYEIETGRGSSFRVHCPFHEDERPSCSVNPGKKMFNCFGCGENGNVLDFIAAMENFDPKAEFRTVLEVAIEIIGHNPTPEKGSGSGKRHKSKTKKGKPENKRSLKEVGNEQSPASNPKPNKQRRKRKTKKKIEAESQLEPNRVLEGPAFPLKLEKKHAFLKQRGFDRELLNGFGIGYEPRSNAMMTGRICFPIHNAKGELVAYSGRWAGEEVDAAGNFIDSKGRVQERYKLPNGFKKQLELYNLHRVLSQYPKRKQRRKVFLVVVEGFWSVLRLHSLTRSNKGKQNGNIPVVALMGCSISPQQIALLREYGFSRIVLMLDGDDEGKAASKKIIPKLAKHFFVKDANLPDGAKPDTVDEKFLLGFVQSTPKQKPEPKHLHSTPEINASASP